MARGYADYIDSLCNGTIQDHFEKWVPIHVTGLSSYPDPISFFLTLALTRKNDLTSNHGCPRGSGIFILPKIT